MAQRGYVTPHPDLDAERMEREAGRAARAATCRR